LRHFARERKIQREREREEGKEGRMDREQMTVVTLLPPLHISFPHLHVSSHLLILTLLIVTFLNHVERVQYLTHPFQQSHTPQIKKPVLSRRK
jgi:hypothetical protein